MAADRDAPPSAATKPATVAGFESSPVLVAPAIAEVMCGAAVRLCRGDQSDALTALLGAMLILLAASKETDELAGILAASIEYGRAQVERNRAAEVPA